MLCPCDIDYDPLNKKMPAHDVLAMGLQLLHEGLSGITIDAFQHIQLIEIWVHFVVGYVRHAQSA